MLDTGVPAMRDRAVVREVGLRDGLQLVETLVPTDIKIEWIREQVDCGFTEIEVTSFVPPTVIPQFGDAGAILEGIRDIDALTPMVLVPNLKGAQLAMDCGAVLISYVLSVSEAHNRANVNRTTDESIAAFTDIVAERKSRGLDDAVRLSCVMATSFGCSIQGDVPEGRVFEIADQLLDAGADELNVADTVGYGNPVQVKRILAEIAANAGDVPIAAHFHDTRGMGLANVVAALEAGVARFDASLGGLGGCPFAPGATGNIATEDSVYLLESMGLSTGVDLEALLVLREKLKDWLPGQRLEGRVGRAGLARNFHPA